MICYFGTSAFVPLLIAEPSSPACRRLWDEADDVITTQQLYVEAAAALAQAVRGRRISAAREAEAVRALDEFWQELYIVKVSEVLVRRAAALASSGSLRGYDALHCATAEQVDDRDLVFASGDRRQLEAGQSLGFYVADVNDPDFV
jgi:predicted nucleic acid-binding protein